MKNLKKRRLKNQNQLTTDKYSCYRRAKEARMKKKNILENISVGDLLHYCPEDSASTRHDIGIIYKIENEKNIYHIYWARTQMNDWFSASTLLRRLKETYNHKNVMKIIKQNE